MAKLSWSAVTVDGTVTQDGPTISDAQMDRFLDWVWYAYPQFDLDVEDGETPIPLPRNNANTAKAVRDWADAQWRGTKANVLRHERNEVAEAARDAILDIS